MLKSKTFSDLLKVCSVLPALLVMPAMGAFPLNGKDYNLDEMSQMASGSITEGLKLTNATATWTMPQINITPATSEHAIELDEGSSITLGGANTTDLEINSTKDGLNLASAKDVKLNATNITILSTQRAIRNTNDSTDHATNVSINGTTINIGSKKEYGVVALGRTDLSGGANIDIKGTTVDISTDYSGNSNSAVHAGQSGVINIDAETVNITGYYAAVSAMTKGVINIEGDTTIKTTLGDIYFAVGTRGDAVVNINKSGMHTVNITGGVYFVYDNGIPVDSTIDITLVGKESNWTGLTAVSYGKMDAESARREAKDGLLAVKEGGLTLTMKDGASWDVVAFNDSFGSNNAGVFHVAVKQLNLYDAIININDTEYGVVARNADITKAEINNGTLTILESLNLTSGLTGTGSLAIASGATADIGDSLINLKSITLDGTMNAVLDTHNPLFGKTDFAGDGDLVLTAKKAGEYNLTSGSYTFAGTHTVNSSVFDATWINDNTVNVALKSVEDIAADNNLTKETAQTVANLTESSSEKLNDFGVLVQNALAAGDAAAVEHAHRAINPADASVAQSVSGHVQSTVTALAANRMGSAFGGMTGRAGGDSTMTAGGVWAQGLYNKSKLNGAFDGYTRGVAAGIDLTDDDAITIGVGYAFNHSDIDVHTRDTEINSHTAFIYGQYKPAEWYLNATLNYTMSDYDESSYALGTAIDASYDIGSFGANVAAGYDFANGITPEVALRYMHIDGDTYTTSLDIQNKIDSTDYLTAIVGAKYATDFISTGFDLTLRPEVRAAVKYDIMSDDALTTVNMPGINSYSIRGERLNRTAAEAGVGVTMLYHDVELSLTYDIELRKDYTSQTGMVRARYNF